MKRVVVVLVVMGTLLFPLQGKAQTANATNDVGVNAGNATVGDSSQSLSISGGSAPAQLPMTTQIQPTGANIYGPLGNTPGSASVPFSASANNLCKVVYTRKYRPTGESTEDTNSKNTRLRFNHFPTLQAMKDSRIETEEVLPPNLAINTYNNVKCLGTITMWTKEKAGTSTDFGMVEGDAINHVFDTVRGYRRVALVSLIDAVSAASGVSTDGSSFGVGGALGHIVSALTSAGIAPTFTKGSGQANPTNFPGGTFLVLALDQSNGQTVDMAQMREFFKPPPKQTEVVIPDSKK